MVAIDSLVNLTGLENLLGFAKIHYVQTFLLYRRRPGKSDHIHEGKFLRYCYWFWR